MYGGFSSPRCLSAGVARSPRRPHRPADPRDTFRSRGRHLGSRLPDGPPEELLDPRQTASRENVILVPRHRPAGIAGRPDRTGDRPERGIGRAVARDRSRRDTPPPPRPAVDGPRRCPTPARCPRPSGRHFAALRPSTTNANTSAGGRPMVVVFDADGMTLLVVPERSGRYSQPPAPGGEITRSGPGTVLSSHRRPGDGGRKRHPRPIPGPDTRLPEVRRVRAGGPIRSGGPRRS